MQLLSNISLKRCGLWKKIVIADVRSCGATFRYKNCGLEIVHRWKKVNTDLQFRNNISFKSADALLRKFFLQIAEFRLRTTKKGGLTSGQTHRLFNRQKILFKTFLVHEKTAAWSIISKKVFFLKTLQLSNFKFDTLTNLQIVDVSPRSHEPPSRIPLYRRKGLDIRNDWPLCRVDERCHRLHLAATTLP